MIVHSGSSIGYFRDTRLLMQSWSEAYHIMSYTENAENYE